MFPWTLALFGLTVALLVAGLLVATRTPPAVPATVADVPDCRCWRA